MKKYLEVYRLERGTVSPFSPQTSHHGETKTQNIFLEKCLHSQKKKMYFFVLIDHTDHTCFDKEFSHHLSRCVRSKKNRKIRKIGKNL